MHYKKIWLDAEQTRLNLEIHGKLQYGKFQSLQTYIFELKETPPAHITFDLAEVEIIDSSGLGLLIIANEITGNQRNVTLKHPNEQLEQLFSVCKIGDLMEIVL